MDIQQLMQQAKVFQEKMAEVQNELGKTEATSTVGGGMVTATVNGRNELVDLRIDAEIINPEDPQMLQDLVKAAVNDAVKKVAELTRAEMSKIAGGLNMPGLF